MSLKQAILNSSGFFSITSLKNGKKQNKTKQFLLNTVSKTKSAAQIVSLKAVVWFRHTTPSRLPRLVTR